MTKDLQDQSEVVDARESLDRLLSKLDADRTLAWEKHEEIRRRLIKFFDCRQCSRSEELADITLVRVAKKLTSGEICNVAAYSIGVARYVLLEEARRAPQQRPLEDIPGGPNGLVDSRDQVQQILESLDSSVRLACLRECLGDLKAPDQALVIAYYSAEEKQRIEHRRLIAERAGKTKEALMTYVSRLRDKLELCVTKRLDERRRSIKAAWDRQQQ
jgi:DNA-directed RNA polymerase specialized sigma24 family protein